MKVTRMLTTTIGASLILCACGGGDASEGVNSTVSSGQVTTTADPAAAPSSTAQVAATAAPSETEATIPSDFPVPIMDGGNVESAYATEVTVLYSTEQFDALFDYYQAVADANQGTHFDLFPDGHEWAVQGIQIQMFPADPTTHPDRPEGTVLFVRLP